MELDVFQEEGFSLKLTTTTKEEKQSNRRKHANQVCMLRNRKEIKIYEQLQ